MLYLDGGIGLAILGLWIFCLIDVIVTDEHRMRNLPKVAWVLIVLLLPTVGSIVWLVAGRPNHLPARPANRVSSRFPEYDRPGRHIAQDPAADEEFLRGLRERAEDQRRKAAEERRAREQSE